MSAFLQSLAAAAVIVAVLAGLCAVWWADDRRLRRGRERPGCWWSRAPWNVDGTPPPVRPCAKPRGSK